jgi:N-acetylmuramoyl-L-alanine amidase
MRIRERASPNHDARPGDGTVDMLILHYTGMTSAAAALERLCDPAAKVSAHYLIEEDGAVWRLVDESRRAWHAGVSSWRGRSDINGGSIGIELANPGHEFGYRPFPAAQMAALEELARAIQARHPIRPGSVLGHSDVAPDRKQDPGELFDWRRLARAGIGFWPDFDRDPGSSGNPADIGATLGAIGYATTPLAAAIAAFQRHWRPALCDGNADSETCRRAAIVAQGIA